MPRTGGREKIASRGLADRLFQPVDIASIVYFRIAFGLMMALQIRHEFASGNAEHIYVRPRIHFSYFGFEWVEPLPGSFMYGLLIALAVFGICIAVGFAYRVVMPLFFLGFTYTFLLDKAAYQNHLYLICLISFLMCLIPANRSASVDVRLGWARRANSVPAWMLWILLFQIGVVYFFGGVAKINPDWLDGQPIGLWLSRRADWPVIGPFVHSEWFVGLFTFGGLLLDLLIVPALLWKRTRAYAFIVAVVFHVTNNWIFSIGIFPWLMILATAMYFPPDWPRRILSAARRHPGLESGSRKRTRRARSKPASNRSYRAHTDVQSRRPKLVTTLLGLYVLIQIGMPLRHYFYPGDANWTEEGHYFSWHMMLRYKEIERQEIVVKDAVTKKTWTVRLRDYMDFWQARNMLGNPDMLLQFSHILAQEKRRQGIAKPQVFAMVRVALNGRRPQPIVDPNVDLAAQPRTLAPKKWVFPVQ